MTPARMFGAGPYTLISINDTTSVEYYGKWQFLSARAESEGRFKVMQTPITPLAIIQFERKDQLRLCDGLELVADQLPDEVDFSLYESVYEKLHINLPVYHRNEEAFFECVIGHEPSWMDASAVLERVRFEHAVHDCYADELSESLENLRTGSGLRNPDSTGYLLRFCFETIRRHVAWEDFVLMPLAEQALTPEKMASLSDIVARNRKAIKPNMV